MAEPPQRVTFTTQQDLLVEQRQTGVYVSLGEWRRLRKHVRAIREPAHWIRNLAWFLLALIPAGLLAWSPWSATYGQLPTQTKLDYAWVSPSIVLFVLVGAGGGIVCWLISRTHQGETEQDKARVLDDMNAIEERYGVQVEPD